MTEQRYKTKPLDCYPKARELRLSHFQDIMSAREKGKLLIGGSVTIGLYEIAAGLGDVVSFADDEYAVSIAADADFSTKASAAAEAKGFGRDVCGYTLNYVGSMLLDRFLFGGKFPKPNFIFTEHNCDGRGKWAQVVADYLDIPIFIYENPCRQAGQRSNNHIQYLVNQFNEAIEWMERITKKRYDDEKLIAATNNYLRTARLWGEICLLNRTIPAPLDARALISLMAVPIERRHEKVGVEFLEMLRDEVRYRVDNTIAASPREKCRLMLEGNPPFAALPLLHWTQEKYGVTWLGTLVYTGLYGEIEALGDGTLDLVKTPEERGLVLRTREDALLALAESIQRSWLEQRITHPVSVNPLYISLVRYLNANGVLLDLTKSCPANAASIPERKFAFQNAGIPVAVYESSASRPADVDLGAIRAILKTFLEETMGLSELAD
jgi:benzoyl-CoA reductase subunit B